MTLPVQQEARALGDPTRYRLFRYIADASRPVSVAELTAHVRLNHNTVRQHLAVLAEAGLIVGHATAGPGPGRPRLLYRQRPEVAGRWDTPGAYAWLAGVLATAVRCGQDARQAGATRACAAPPSWPVLAIRPACCWRRSNAAASAPRPATATAQRIRLTLGRCPVSQVAAADPGAVCQLHLGLAEGLAAGLGGLAIERLEPRNSPAACCRLTVVRQPGAPAGGRAYQEDQPS